MTISTLTRRGFTAAGLAATAAPWPALPWQRTRR